MSNYEQKENTGALFEANNMKVLRQGKSLVNGHDCELIVTCSQTKDGRTLFDTYMKVGGFFPNQYKQEGDSKPDVTAPVLIHGEKMKLAGWKNVSKRGVHYVSLSLKWTFPIVCMCALVEKGIQEICMFFNELYLLWC